MKFAVRAVVRGVGPVQHVLNLPSSEDIQAKLERVYPDKDVVVSGIKKLAEKKDG